MLHRLNWKIALAFLDDVPVLGKSEQEHLDNLCQVFERFRKCEQFRHQEILGRTVSKDGVEIGDQY